MARLKHRVDCQPCRGIGACPDCEGRGLCLQCDGLGCEHCEATGDCLDCDGDGLCVECDGEGTHYSSALIANRRGSYGQMGNKLDRGKNISEHDWN